MEEGSKMGGNSAAGMTHNRQTRRPERARKRRLTLLLMLLGLLLFIVAFGSYYFITRKPINELPVVQAVTKNTPPRFLFSMYGVNKPVGVAISPDGQRVFVSESDGDRYVKVFDRNGRLQGNLPVPDSGARQPVYIAVERTGKVYVSDRTRNAIMVYSPEGKYLGTFPAPTSTGKWSPIGLTVDRMNNLYVTDVTSGLHQVFMFDLEGNAKLHFGSEGQGRGSFLYPNGVAIDSRGRLFVTNSNNSRVDMFDGAGKFLSSFGTGSSAGSVGIPRGIVVDEQNRLYVVDAISHVIVVFDASKEGIPTFLYNFGQQGIDDGEFLFPNGIATDPTGRFYITDRENHRVQVWTY